MKKVTYALIVIIILLIILVFIWPFVMGVSVRSQVFEMSKPGFFNNPQQNLKVINYHTGWLKSDMELQYTIPLLAGLPGAPNTKNFVFDIKLHVINGPISKLSNPLTDKSWGWGRVAASGTITFVSPSAKQYPNFKILSRPIAFEAWVNWRGHITMHTHWPAGVIYQDKSGLIVTSGPITETGVINKTLTTIAAHGTMPSIQIKRGDHEANISRLNYALNGKKGLADIWYGVEKINIPHVSVVDGKRNLAQIQHIAYTASSALDANQKLGVNMNADVGTINAQGQKIGPVHFSIAANKLQPQAAGKLQKQLVNVMPKFAKLANEKADPAWSDTKKAQFNNQQSQAIQALFLKLQPNVIALITGSALDTNLAITIPQGKAQASAKITLPDQFSGAATDPNALLNLLSASNAMMHVTAAKPLVMNAIDMAALAGIGNKDDSGKQAQNMAATLKKMRDTLQALVSNDVIRENQTDYLTTMTYANHSVAINGHSLIDTIARLENAGLIPSNNNSDKQKQGGHKKGLKPAKTGSKHASQNNPATT